MHIKSQHHQATNWLPVLSCTYCLPAHLPCPACTGGAQEEDIIAELGVGSVAADAELDAMKEQAEAQILSMRSLLGPHARLVSAGALAGGAAAGGSGRAGCVGPALGAAAAQPALAGM